MVLGWGRLAALAGAVAVALAGCTASSLPTTTPTTSATAPASVNTTQPGPEAVWAALRRPLRLHAVAPGARCPQSPGQPVDTGEVGGWGLGPGPAYPLFATTATKQGAARYGRFPTVDGWKQIRTVWLVQPRYDLPVLVRGRRLDRGGEMRFWLEGFGSLGGVATTSTGERIGTELHLDEGWVSERGWRQFPASTWFRGAGCYGFQVDGRDFSYAIVFQTAP